MRNLQAGKSVVATLPPEAVHLFDSTEMALVNRALETDGFAEPRS